MRFAWLRKNSANYVPVKQGRTRSLTLIKIVYNIAYWVFLLPFFTAVDYGTGFIAFTVIIFVRLSANLYINILNLKPEQFEIYPLRS